MIELAQGVLVNFKKSPGRSAKCCGRVVTTPKEKSTRETSIFYRARSVAILHKLLRPNVWHTNHAAHGGFCINMATAGIYTMGGAFWEFGQPDWDYTKLFIRGCEDHDSSPIKMGIGKIKERGAKIVGVNPIRTGYNAVADEWLGITLEQMAC